MGAYREKNIGFGLSKSISLLELRYILQPISNKNNTIILC